MEGEDLENRTNFSVGLGVSFPILHNSWGHTRRQNNGARPTDDRELSNPAASVHYDDEDLTLDFHSEAQFVLS